MQESVLLNASPVRVESQSRGEEETVVNRLARDSVHSSQAPSSSITYNESSDVEKKER